MKRPRFQFSLKHMLLAMFWMAVCYGEVVANRTIAPEWDFRGPKILLLYLRYVTFYAGGASPFIAAGALFGRAKAGAIIGFIAIAVLAVVVTSFALFEPGMNQSPDETRQRIADCTTTCVLLAVGVLAAILGRKQLFH